MKKLLIKIGGVTAFALAMYFNINASSSQFGNGTSLFELKGAASAYASEGGGSGNYTMVWCTSGPKKNTYYGCGSGNGLACGTARECPL